jgi:hypothetical protein
MKYEYYTYYHGRWLYRQKPWQLHNNEFAEYWDNNLKIWRICAAGQRIGKKHISGGYKKLSEEDVFLYLL